MKSFGLLNMHMSYLQGQRDHWCGGNASSVVQLDNHPLYCGSYNARILLVKMLRLRVLIQFNKLLRTIDCTIMFSVRPFFGGKTHFLDFLRKPQSLNMASFSDSELLIVAHVIDDSHSGPSYFRSLPSSQNLLAIVATLTSLIQCRNVAYSSN
jgi:hypothetical protein